MTGYAAGRGEARGPVVLGGLEALSVRTLQELDRLGERAVLIAGTRGDGRHRVLATELAERMVEGDPRAGDPGTVVTLVDDRSTSPTVLPAASSVVGVRLSSLVEVDATAADAARRRPGRGRGPRPRSLLRRVDRRFWVLGAVLAAITVGAALVFEVARGLSPIDAIATTVGGFFGAVDSDIASTPELKLSSIVLTPTGAAALALFYGLIADVVLSARMCDLLGPRPTDARDHVIVVGLGTIGFRIARSLQAAGVPVVAAERRADGRFVEEARDLGIPVSVTPPTRACSGPWAPSVRGRWPW